MQPPQAPLARMSWLRSSFHHLLAFLQTLFQRNGTRKEPAEMKQHCWSALLSPFFSAEPNSCFSQMQKREASLSWRREKFSLPTKTPRRQNTRICFFGPGQHPFPPLHLSVLLHHSPFSSPRVSLHLEAPLGHTVWKHFHSPNQGQVWCCVLCSVLLITTLFSFAWHSTRE